MRMAFLEAIDSALADAPRFRCFTVPGVLRLFLVVVLLAVLILAWPPSLLVATAQSTTPELKPRESTSVVAPKSSVELVRFLKEETVVTAARHEQPISQAPSNIYVITDEDIRHSGATDIPTLLRRIPGIEVIQMTGADFNVSARGDNQLGANKMLVLVDGRS